MKKFITIFWTILFLLIFSQALAGVSQSKQNIAKKLNWIIMPNNYNLCGGYYFQKPIIYTQTVIPGQPSNIVIKADESKVPLNSRAPSVLTGNVIMTQPGRQVMSNKAVIYHDKSNQVSVVKVTGDVHIREPGLLIMGNQAEVKLQPKTSTVHNALYRISIENQNLSGESDKLYGVTGWGHAKTIHKYGKKLIVLHHATYTASPPTHDAWHIRASKIRLNRQSGWGQSYNTVIYIKKTPVFYTPYYSFPITDKRMTGFLFPTTSTSDSTGFAVSLPYYWNLAPNYDDTFTPTYMSKRGMEFSNLFRYLTYHSQGQFIGSILPNDVMDKQQTRWLVSWQNLSIYNSHWSSVINYSRVSDNNFFKDLNNDYGVNNNGQVTQLGQLKYQSEHWDFMGELSGYQTINPTGQTPIASQYSRLPELSLSGYYPNQPGGLSYSLGTQYTFFDIVPSSKLPYGSQVLVQPSVSLPLTRVWGFVTPQILVNGEYYGVKRQPNMNISGMPISVPNSISEAIPTFDIYAGLFYTRKIHLFGHDFNQSLEPQLFYVYTPYVNQTNIPLFDTTAQPFSYQQMFLTNRFAGSDRIGDANQVTLAVTSNFTNPNTGVQILSASVGEIFYFQNRRVSLATPNSGPILQPTSPTEPSSPIAGELSFALAPSWSAIANYAWDPHLDTTVSSGFNLVYRKSSLNIINIGYDFIQNGTLLNPVPTPTSSTITPKASLDLFNISSVWNFTRRWTLFAQWSYDMANKHNQNILGGVAYNSCSWAVRLVGTHVFDSQTLSSTGRIINTFDNGVYLQFTLKSLGNVGDDSIRNRLQTAIPGYIDRFGQIQGMNT